MITEDDSKKLINKMKKVFVTKEDLKNAFTDSESGLNKRIDRVIDSIDYKFNKLDKLHKDFSEFKESITKRLDWLVGAFKKFDEEHTVLSHQNERATKQLENHETRIKILEKSPAFQ